MTQNNQAAQVVGALAALSGRNTPSKTTSASGIADVIAALDEFQECIRYLNTRRSEGAVLKLESEAAVQDALYLILRPWVRDLVPETPTDKSGNRYTIRDFFSRALRCVVEAKLVRNAVHGKTISRELHDDIECYRHHNRCETIIFFIYDPDSLIPDQRELKRTIEQKRVYDGCPLTCRMIIKP